MSEVVHKELEDYRDGDVIQAKVRIDRSYIRWSFGTVTHTNEVEPEEELEEDWIKVGTEYFSPEEYDFSVTHKRLWMRVKRGLAHSAAGRATAKQAAR
jgi:hypothetical protein